MNEAGIRRKNGKTSNIKEVKVAEQQTEIDPRSKTTADKAYNLIGTGGPEEEVKGQGAVLAEKKEDLKRTNYVVQCSKVRVKRGSTHIYKKKQETKMKMADAQLAACR